MPHWRIMGVNTELPKDFFDCMRETLGGDFDRYMECFELPPHRGLRVNTLKATEELLRRNLGIEMIPTPFCKDGFYIDNGISGLGNHPLHHAGAFYLQEPSAMSAVTALDVKPGERVLDLCAAPGGKSTQIASALCGDGLLWANEINPSRAKILCSNIERMGVKNAVVSNASPDVLSSELEGFFDKVLVDAPCSGEGMIRREQNAVIEWKRQNRSMCADRQLKILDSAANMLRPGGVMVYSTCTLSGEENEQAVEAFLKSHPEFSLDDISAGFGRAAYTHLCDTPDIVKARRILFMDGGEGHFVARLKKNGGEEAYTAEYSAPKSDVKLFEQFYSEHFSGECGECVRFGDDVWLVPPHMPQTRRVKILKFGVNGGKIVKNRFAPHHDLYMSRRFGEQKNIIDLPLSDERVKSFLSGAEIEGDKSGYCAVAVCGVVLGFGKASGGRLKNHYPKGLRILK